MLDEAQARVAVLIAEDDPGLRAMLGTALTLEGFAVQEAANGAEALSAVRRRKPDVVLLDLVMPWVNGLEVLTAIRMDPATEDVPVIVMTGTPAQPHDLRGLGPVDLMHKPIEIEALLARVAAALRRSRKTLEI